jgi:hypothetical protein
VAEFKTVRIANLYRRFFRPDCTVHICRVTPVRVVSTTRYPGRFNAYANRISLASLSAEDRTQERLWNGSTRVD